MCALFLSQFFNFFCLIVRSVKSPRGIQESKRRDIPQAHLAQRANRRILRDVKMQWVRAHCSPSDHDVKSRESLIYCYTLILLHLD
jgi:hypothetical protein